MAEGGITMASGRFLSVSIAEDDKLSRLSITAELIYLKTIPHLDRDGMISGKPGFLWGKVCPLREDLFGQTAGLIEEWIAVGLVVRFMTEEGPALFFKGFSKNNNLPHYDRERPSRFPPPPGYTRTDGGLIPEGSVPPPSKAKGKKPAPIPPPSSGTPANILDQVQELVQEFELQEQEEEEEEDKDHSISAKSESTKEPTLSERVFDRLESEWSIVNPGQMDRHMELATRYGYEAWVAGLERCTHGKRSNQAYVEKAILSAIDEKPSLKKKEPKAAPTHRYIITDPITGVRKEMLQ